jgi:hypothetical protein
MCRSTAAGCFAVELCTAAILTYSLAGWRTSRPDLALKIKPQLTMRDLEWQIKQELTTSDLAL